MSNLLGTQLQQISLLSWESGWPTAQLHECVSVGSHVPLPNLPFIGEGSDHCVSTCVCENWENDGFVCWLPREWGDQGNPEKGPDWWCDVHDCLLYFILREGGQPPPPLNCVYVNVWIRRWTSVSFGARRTPPSLPTLDNQPLETVATGLATSQSREADNLCLNEPPHHKSSFEKLYQDMFFLTSARQIFFYEKDFNVKQDFNLFVRVGFGKDLKDRLK